MADQQNSMQMNMGLMPGVGPQGMTNTPSPAQTAMMLSKQAMDNLVSANQQMRQATQFMHANPSITAIARQVQSQISNIQSSMTVVPPAGATGQFAPPQMGSQGPGISPMPQASMFQTPFTPRPAPPMFQTAWDQEMQQRNVRADKLYSYAMQAPSMAGQGAAYGAAALAGARMGSQLGGPVGGVLGAAGGMMAAGMSGVAQGVGQMAATPFQPMREAHDMGAAIQRVSQNWVIGGSQQAGLGRGPSIEMAKGISQMAGDSGFQKQTGGMFNQQDLMQIMGQAGQAGLMDQSQDIQSIKQNLRTTAQTIKEFMELTNDPDVSNVIRTMGQLRDTGMSQMQMRGAAANLKMYSRSAGMSLGQMGQAGGAGAQAFGAAGLAPDTGYGYGMQAMTSARQMVASGTLGPRQLAMAGGVQGLAGREMQAQAGYMGMPALSMAASQFTPQGGWQMDPNALEDMMGQGVGAKAMMKRAKTQMQEGYERGGGEALAMWPLQQRAVAAQVAESVTPEQATLMRFRTAEATGREMGMSTRQGAFALGARRLYGEDIATQMTQQASSPEFWKMQQQGVQRRQTELGRQQYAAKDAAAPWAITDVVGGALEQAGISGGVREIGRDLSRFGRGVKGAFEGVGDYFEDAGARSRGETISRRDPRGTMRTKEQRTMRKTNVQQMLNVMDEYGQEFSQAEGMYSDMDISGTTYNALMRSQGGEGASAWADTGLGVGLGAVSMLSKAAWVPLMAAGIAGYDPIGAVQEGAAELRGQLEMGLQDNADVQDKIKQGMSQQRKLMQIYNETPTTVRQSKGVMKDLGMDEGSYNTVMAVAGAEFASTLRKKQPMGGGVLGAVAEIAGKDQDPVTLSDYKKALRTGLSRQFSPKEVEQKMKELEKSGKDVQLFKELSERGSVDPREADILSKAEAQTRELETRLSDAGAATRARGVEEMGTMLGEEIWGKEKSWYESLKEGESPFGQDYSSFEETLSGVAGGLTGKTAGIELAAMVAMGGTPEEAEERDEEMKALYKKRMGSMEGYLTFQGRVRARRKKLIGGEGGGDIKDALEAARKGGADLSKVMTFGTEMGQARPFREGIAEALTSIGGVSQSQISGAQLLKTESIAGLVSEEDRERMIAGGGKGKILGGLLQDIGTAESLMESGDITEKEYKKVQASILSKMSGLGERGAEETTGPSATGAEAAKLRKTQDALIKAQNEFTSALSQFASPDGTFHTAINKFEKAVGEFETETKPG